MRIENFPQNSSYNGATVVRPDMSNYSLMARQYRLYFIVAVVVAFIIFCITIVLAVLLYSNIHYLDKTEDDLVPCRFHLQGNSTISTT